MGETTEPTATVETEEQPYWLAEASITQKQRDQWAKQGIAMPDGSWPIPDLPYLDKAIQSWGRAVNAGNSDAVKAHMLKRAKALGASKDKIAQIQALGTKAEADASGNPSLQEQADDITQAWYDACRQMATDNPWTSTGYSSWPVETYDDHIIVRAGEDFWSIPFTRSADDETITFDVTAATEVERRWIAVAEGEEWLARPIAEADGKQPDGSKWEVTIIRAGKSKNRRRYPEAVLKKAAPLFEGARVLARSDEDHIEGKNKSIEKIVGWLSEVTYGRGAIRGTFNVLPNAQWLKDMLVGAWNSGKKDLVGLSIVAEGHGKAVKEGGESLVEVESITKVSSVDLVFDPAAGGGLVKLVAAIGKEEAHMGLEELTIEQLKTSRADLVEQLLKEGKPADPANPDPGKTNEPAPEHKPEPVAVAEAEEEDVPVVLSRMVVKEALSETKLPELVKAKISKTYAGQSFKLTALEGAIKDEIDLWAELEKERPVRSAGESKPSVEVTVEEAERWKAGLDGFFLGEDVELNGTKIPRFKSFKKCYIEGTGDVAVSGRLPRRPSGRLGISEANWGAVQLRLHEADESGEMSLSEAISMTTFNLVLGDSVTRAMVRDYRLSDLRGTWDPIVDIVPINDFRTQRRERFGGYGNLPTVAQAGAYVALTSPANEEATYAPTKKGGTETINLEAIMNDDIQAIRRIPGRLARAAARTLQQYILNFLLNNSAIYDSVALAASGHGSNILTTPLSTSSLSLARSTMLKQADMSVSADPLGLVPKYLYVPPELEQLAYELTNSDRKAGTSDNDANFIRAQMLNYLVIPYWSATDANNWWVTASKDQTPLIEAGFLTGEDPELFTQDMPNVGSMFNNDQLTYKIRHIYGAAVLDFRGFVGGIVA